MKYNNRILGGFEKVLWLLDQHIPTHFVIAAEIEGRTSINHWQSALINLQLRHPLFSVRITGNEYSTVRFQHVDERPIPFRIVPNGQSENLESELESELSSPFDTSQSPLIRTVLVEKETHSTLILSIHHAIGDGISLVLVIRDLLNLLNNQPLDPLPAPPAIDDLLDMNHDQDEDTDYQTPDELSRGRVIGNQRISIVSPIVARLQLPQDFTGKLIRCARQENTTVYAAISAAIIMASRQIYEDGKEKTIRLVTPVSVRETLGLNEGSSICFVSKFTAVTPGQSLTLWDTARYIKSNLAGTKSLDYIKASTQEFRNLAFGGLTVQAAASLMANELDHEFIISNLGVTPYDTNFGAYKLKSIWGPMQFNANPIENSVGIATTNDVISISYASRAPLAALLDITKQILHQLCP